MYSYYIETTKIEDMIKIDHLLEDALSKSGVREGAALLFTPHTTAAITINENADPAVKRDMLYGIRKIVPNLAEYLHLEGNSSAHIRSSLVGASEIVIIKEGLPCLGTWQSLYLMEFDGPRKREVWIQFF